MSKCKVIALANQKGRTAKTTTTLNLGIGLAHQGRKVLLVDADPQGDLTTALGWTTDVYKRQEVLEPLLLDGCLSSVDISEQMQLSRSLHLI